MTVLGEHDEWPTRPMLGTAPADMRTEPKSISELIHKPCVEFYKRTGRPPTHLLLGWNAQQQLTRELSGLPSIALAPDLKRKRQYRGMTLIFMEQNGIELLNDLDMR